MLKSDTLIVAFRDETVVWRWRNPAPVEFLFMKRQAATFITKAAGILTQYQVKAPHGALAIATGVITNPRPTDSLASLVNAGTLSETVLTAMPVWISDLELDRMTLSEAQQQLMATGGEDATFTLEI
jgi:hypothetical protein